MTASKFIKNLFQSISFFLSISILLIVLLAGFFVSLQYENAKGWILLVIAVSLVILYFSVGGYWIFQKVEFSKKGIKITLFGKTIQEVLWEDVEDIVRRNIMRNPAYVIVTKDTKEIHLDARSKIRNAIIFWGNEKTKSKMKPLD